MSFFGPCTDPNAPAPRTSQCILHLITPLLLSLYIALFGFIRYAKLKKRVKWSRRKKHISFAANGINSNPREQKNLAQNAAESAAKSGSDEISSDDESAQSTRHHPVLPHHPPSKLGSLIRLLVSLVWMFSLLDVVIVLSRFKTTPSNAPFSPPPIYLVISAISQLFAWSCEFFLLSYEHPRTWKWGWAVQVFWLLAFVLGSVEFYYHVASLDYPTEEQYDYILFTSFLMRYVCMLGVIILAPIMHWIFRKRWNRGPEYAILESNDLENNTNSPNRPQPPEKVYDPPSTFSDYWHHFRKLIPFIWPESDRKLQLLMFLAFIALVMGRVVNLLVPMQYKVVVDALTGPAQELLGTLTTGGVEDEPHKPYFAWGQILLFVLLRFLQGSVGLLTTAQGFFWIPVGQYTTREISIKMFQHLHSLSLRFHINRKTGEILRVQDRGVESIVSLLNSILFNILPTLVDILIACFYFVVLFDIYFGIIVFLTMTLYIWSTITLTEWRTQYRRMSNALDNKMQAKAVDSLLNHETVKYYNAEDFEVEQYGKSMSDFQYMDYKSSAALMILNTAQNTLIQMGLLAGCLLCASRIVKGDMTVGDFVLFLSYITQLYGPLNWFGNYYRTIQKNFVDMEKMLDLFNEPQEVRDLPNAGNLVLKEGNVTFENVCFFYDQQQKVPALRNISFNIPRGHTVALVGPSGGGKSTILRLLFRFYDVHTGRILIDGQDIRHVTQKSLRKHIGVVPQDTVLFNDSIRYNIRYAKVTATDAEVEKAAKRAKVHHKILGFSEGYDTQVGERGLRLSGGEKQRIAIARTLLKNPEIVLLDEATSALDTTTERQIQRSLRKLSTNRTTLVIAHRLSTIVNADTILVIHDGQIVEQGNHQQLLALKGEYYEMWTKQLEDERDAFLGKLDKKKKKGREEEKNSGRKVEKENVDITDLQLRGMDVNIEETTRRDADPTDEVLRTGALKNELRKEDTFMELVATSPNNTTRKGDHDVE